MSDLRVFWVAMGNPRLLKDTCAETLPPPFSPMSLKNPAKVRGFLEGVKAHPSPTGRGGVPAAKFIKEQTGEWFGHYALRTWRDSSIIARDGTRVKNCISNSSI